MRIDRVSYAKLFNLGNYENERIELEAAVDCDEGHADVLDALVTEVRRIGEELANERGLDTDAAYKEHGALARLQRLNAEIAIAQGRWYKAKELLLKHGVDSSDLEADDDIPY